MLQEASQKMYDAAGAAGGEQPEGTGEAPPADDNVQDADYEVVDD